MARIYRNHKNYSVADCIKVLKPSPHRVSPKCEIFGVCGGCQYQHAAYEQQLLMKRNQVKECFAKISNIDLEVQPVIGSPKTYGYRSKLTPHYDRPKDGVPSKLGFLKHASRRVLIDVSSCPIATDGINNRLPRSRASLFKLKKKNEGGHFYCGKRLKELSKTPTNSSPKK